MKLLNTAALVCLLLLHSIESATIQDSKGETPQSESQNAEIDKLDTDIGCTDSNCTDIAIEKSGGSSANLAWLVTPGLFGLGIIYGIYKCCKDGLCNCRRLRRQAALEYQRENGYIPLSQVVIPFQGPASAREPHQQLVVINNQSFCISLRDVPHGHRCPHHSLLTVNQDGTTRAVPIQPPTYEEALNEAGTVPSEGPPRYSVAIGEESETGSVAPEGEEEEHDISTDNVEPLSVAPCLQVRFAALPEPTSSGNSGSHSSRRRHFSAQDRRRSETNEPMSFRQRCFSFNALRDSLRRVSPQVENQGLLLDSSNSESTDEGSGDGSSVLLSLELCVQRLGNATGQSQTLTGSELLHVLPENLTTQCGECCSRRFSIQQERPVGSRRQRHASAPDPSRRSRNPSGGRLRHPSGPPFKSAKFDL